MTGLLNLPENIKLEPVGYDRLNGWNSDNHLEALRVFTKTFEQKTQPTFKIGIIGIPTPDLQEIAALARNIDDQSSARVFFETCFQPFLITPTTVVDKNYPGFVTAYYEPEVEASRVRSEEFCAPLYARPPDLVGISDKNRPKNMDAEFRFGRLIDMNGHRKIIEYPDRAAIEAGHLEGKGLEIAFVKDRAEALYIHIQGSARLRFEDGSTTRIAYAAKSGHPYTAVGTVLIQNGDLQPEHCGMSEIRNWFAKNPPKTDNVINQNRSFIFFREYSSANSNDGPLGAAKTSLTPGRSLAVDRLLHTFGTPFWIETRDPLPSAQQPFNSLMIAQDTGSAIVGPARGDLFLGSGSNAGNIAGNVRHHARFYVLVPKTDNLS